KGFLAGQRTTRRVGAIGTWFTTSLVLRARALQDGRDFLLEAFRRPGVLDHDALRGLAELDLLLPGQVLRRVDEQGRRAEGMAGLKLLDHTPSAHSGWAQVEDDAVELLLPQHGK